MKGTIFFKRLAGLSVLSLFIALYMAYNGNIAAAGPFVIGFLLLLAISFRGFTLLRGLTFTTTILSVVATALYYPQYFKEYNGFEFAALITPLIQVIMFGMGCSMGVKDFIALAKSPKAVIVGVFSQYTIMPLLGFSLASFTNFSPEISAGIILLGCAPTSVTASVMCYLAKANVVLAITITSITTLLAPFLIPFLMKLLAGGFIEINVMEMMWGIVKMVFIPIGAGLLFNKFLSGKAKWLDDSMPLVSMIGVAFIVAIIMAAGRDSILNIGLELIIVVLLMILFGFFFGYWAARLFKLSERDCRTISITTGTQNAGLVSGIAKVMGKIATVGLATAICGPIMGFTSSILASYWNSNLPKIESNEESIEKDVSAISV
ncbi:MAG: bile acid:sodium symporter family protein [Bacteroidetes bacterium]|jgi:bile acid:Na+ symporter, BASS family|nr:bile acid:sodium symporter family protein [Bacteroidota bacterium]